MLKLTAHAAWIIVVTWLAILEYLSSGRPRLRSPNLAISQTTLESDGSRAAFFLYRKDLLIRSRAAIGLAARTRQMIWETLGSDRNLSRI